MFTDDTNADALRAVLLQVAEAQRVVEQKSGRLARIIHRDEFEVAEFFREFFPESDGDILEAFIQQFQL